MAKQNVSLAAQLMSHTVATGLRQYLAHDDEALELPQVIETVNNWFDVLNSRTTTESMPFKKPFGLAIDAQLMALQEMNQLISTMRCVGKTSIQVFQRAILMSNKSLQSLFSQMKTIYGIKYVITKHLNQDCLESYFGHIRGKGGMATNEDDDFTDTTLSSVESSRGGDNDVRQAENDGLEYLAKVNKEGYAWMGTYTYQLKQSQHLVVPSWVISLSRGGLIEPTDQWLQIVQKMNTYFENYHNNLKFRRNTRVTSRLTKIILKKLSVSLDKNIVAQFVRLRTKIRCNHLSNQIKQEKIERAKQRKLSKLK